MTHLLVHPYTCILTNVPGYISEDKYCCPDLSKLAQALIDSGYPLETITPVTCSSNKHFTGIVRLKLGSNNHSCIAAYKLQEKFEEYNHSNAEWFGTYKPEQGPFLWVATKLDNQYYKSKPKYIKAPYALRRAGRQLAYAENENEYSHINIALCTLSPWNGSQN